jgi:hypothetical protein
LHEQGFLSRVDGTVKGGPLGGELELCLVLGWSVELMGEDSGARVSEHTM